MRKLGMLIFLLAFFTFIASLFLNKYQLSEDLVKELFTSEQQALILDSADSPVGKTYNSKFTFISDLKSSFAEVNKAVTDKYSITDTEVNAIAQAGSTGYNASVLNKMFPGSDEGTKFKKKALNDYTSWMFEKPFKSPEDFKTNLSNSVNSINGSIGSKKGIDYKKSLLFGLIPAQNKDLFFNLVKKSGVGSFNANLPLLFLAILFFGIIGALMHILPKRKEVPGIKNNNIFFDGLNSRGIIGIILGTALISFYCLLYWFPAYIAEWTRMLDPISQVMTGGPAGHWFLYGFLYTTAIVVMGIRFLIKYRHNKYQQVRTFSLMFFQVTFAFIISHLLIKLNLPYMDLKNMWPLDYSFFFDYRINELIESGMIGYFMLGWGIFLFLVGVPVLVYFFGKRWYCSWVCGCGGLAETAGDSFRQQSDKSLGAWKVERYLIHGVLVFAIFMTALVLYTYSSGNSTVMGLNTYAVRESYGFLIGAGFSGVVGTGFYPIMGNRVWCRFGCPLAAYLGLVQRFKSRFRITTNGAQCISCGNCSTYCEMGIDVRAYAQKGQDIVRSSCVGCGVCAAVCPRGVLKLENGPDNSRKIFEIEDGGIKVNV